jgi:replication factor C subunit 2/4
MNNSVLMTFCTTDKENVQVDEATLDALLAASNGDMRKSVTFLQSCHQLTFGTSITPELVIDISGKVGG